MDCDCIEELKLKLKNGGYLNPVIKHMGVIEFDNKIIETTFSVASFKDEKGKNKKLNISHRFCPFCGSRIW